jgi:hypothetical protein
VAAPPRPDDGASLTSSGAAQEGKPLRVGAPLFVASLAFAGTALVLLAARPPAWTLAFLPAPAGAAALALVIGFRSRGAHGRLLGLDICSSLLLGTLAVFWSAQGDPTDFDLAGWAAAVTMGGAAIFAWAWESRGAPASERIPAKPAARPTFAHTLAFVIQGLAFVLALSIWAWGPSPIAVAYAFLAGGASFLPVLGLSLACLWPGRAGRSLRWAALGGLFAASVWYTASTMVALEQARVLPWDEVVYRLAEPGGRAILAESLLSWPAALLAILLFGLHAPLAALLARLAPSTNALTALRLTLGVYAAGTLLIQKPLLFHRGLAERVLVGSVAPWAGFHARDHVAAQRPIDTATASALRARLEPPEWEEGTALPLMQLAGLYQGRSIVLVVLESHRASDVAGLGEGAALHEPLSPELSRLLAEGLSFTNYVGPSHPTSAALWTILTGLPLYSGDPPGLRAPQATRLGRVPDFRRLGYRCDFMCPAPPRFDNWDRLLGEAGARWWIESDEVAGLPQGEWSAWGMPDEQLYRAALSRYGANRAASRPFLLGLLTVSNHSPYSFPERLGDRVLTRDHVGGMLYADHHMGAFLRLLQSGPPADRPVVFVTSDTANLRGLRGIEPAGHEGLEAFRIPGLLLLPDGRLAGESYDGLFCHEDLLDLLYMLVAPTPGSAKFVERRREAASLLGGRIFLTTGSYLLDDRLFAIAERYRLEPRTETPDRERLLELRRRFQEDERRLWPAS